MNYYLVAFISMKCIFQMLCLLLAHVSMHVRWGVRACVMYLSCVVFLCWSVLVNFALFVHVAPVSTCFAGNRNQNKHKLLCSAVNALSSAFSCHQSAVLVCWWVCECRMFLSMCVCVAAHNVFALAQRSDSFVE